VCTCALLGIRQLMTMLNLSVLHVHCALLLCFKIYEKCGQMHIFTILSYGNYLSGKFCDEIIIFTQILSAVSGNLAFSLLFLFWRHNLCHIAYRPSCCIVDLLKILLYAGCCWCCIRHFRLILRKSASVLARNFRVVAVNADGVERIVDIKPTLYRGYLAGTYKPLC